MSPRDKGGPARKAAGERTKKLDKAVRKVEAKEKRQDDRKGKAGKPVRSVGRSIRQGWVDGA